MAEHRIYPQPHEGVRGADRDDLLLSLEPEALPVRRVLAGLSRHLSAATTVGNSAPKVAAMFDRILDPRAGDLVVEHSALDPRDPDRLRKGVGVLLLHREEWRTTDEEWAAYRAEDPTVPDEDRSVDHAWYVQYGPSAGDVCRWTNCDFRTLPAPDERFGFSHG